VTREGMVVQERASRCHYGDDECESEQKRRRERTRGKSSCAFVFHTSSCVRAHDREQEARGGRLRATARGGGRVSPARGAALAQRARAWRSDGVVRK
jgi:hypothetical protein